MLDLDVLVPLLDALGVQLRIHLDYAHWGFGDGTTATLTTAGKPYDPTGDPCRTAQCPDYYGHTYTRTGRMTITLTVSWRAQYRLTGGTWTDIDGPVTGPTSQHVLTVKEARGVATIARAPRRFIASARFLCWERWFWHWTTIPVGKWVMRTALSVVLICWPPAPDAR